MTNVECEGLTKQCHAHPLVPAMMHPVLALVTWSHTRVDVMCVIWQCEGGMGPTVGIEYPSRHTLSDNVITLAG